MLILPYSQGVIGFFIGEQQLSLGGIEASSMTVISHTNIQLGKHYISLWYVECPQQKIVVSTIALVCVQQISNSLKEVLCSISSLFELSNVHQNRQKKTAWDETQLQSYCNSE